MVMKNRATLSWLGIGERAHAHLEAAEKEGLVKATLAQSDRVSSIMFHRFGRIVQVYHGQPLMVRYGQIWPDMVSWARSTEAAHKSTFRRPRSQKDVIGTNVPLQRWE